MLEKALDIVNKKRAELHSLGINHEQLLSMLIRSCQDMQSGAPYRPINLPIQDSELLTVCKERVRLIGFDWGGKEELNEYIINKHIARKRLFTEKHLEKAAIE